MGKYSKFIVAALGALATWATAALADNAVSTQEWVGLGVAVITALGVYQVRNEEVK